MGNVTCLNCAEMTDNHALCNKCFAAAERGYDSFAKRQRGKATVCPRCGYTEADKALHQDHWRCKAKGGAAMTERWQEIKNELSKPWELYDNCDTLALVDACKRIAELEAKLADSTLLTNMDKAFERMTFASRRIIELEKELRAMLYVAHQICVESTTMDWISAMRDQMAQARHRLEFPGETDE